MIFNNQGANDEPEADFFEGLGHGLPEAGRVHHLWKSL
jgi:hypothetical protein